MSLYLGTTPIANTGYDKANINLSNLTNTGKNIANWSNNVTNCITEIPQDIKLELNNGTLTLKAGSKVYVPNGVGVFDAVTTSSDKTVSVGGSTTFDGFIYYATHDNNLRYGTFSQTVSGSSYSITNGYWYDTTNNIIKRIVGGAVSYSGLSFPIAIVSVVSGVITSINQIFNGFGYIGSTVFALPGVKGLIPNGRNADGSLKNIEFTITSVFNRTITGVSNHSEFSISTTGIGINDHTYNESENFLYNSGGTKLTDRFVAGNVTFSQTSPYNVTSFTPKTSFHAVDYNDSPTISGWSMPSSRYINLTLGASGASYTAPANGYFQLAVLAGSSIQFYNQTRSNFWKASISDGNAFAETITCQKGDTILCYYGYTTFRWFRFYYAEGEKNV